MKGQGAMEYLMTYGWALLVIVVVGAALFALGVLNPSTYTQSRCTGFQYFTYQDQRVQTGSYTLDLIDGPRDVTVTAFSVDGTATTGMTTTPNGTISAGARFLVNGNFVSGKSSGDAFSYTAAITYNVVGGISGNVDRATCTGKIA